MVKARTPKVKKKQLARLIVTFTSFCVAVCSFTIRLEAYAQTNLLGLHMLPDGVAVSRLTLANETVTTRYLGTVQTNSRTGHVAGKFLKGEGTVVLAVRRINATLFVLKATDQGGKQFSRRLRLAHPVGGHFQLLSGFDCSSDSMTDLVIVDRSRRHLQWTVIENPLHRSARVRRHFIHGERPDTIEWFLSPSKQVHFVALEHRRNSPAVRANLYALESGERRAVTARYRKPLGYVNPVRLQGGERGYPAIAIQLRKKRGVFLFDNKGSLVRAAFPQHRCEGVQLLAFLTSQKTVQTLELCTDTSYWAVERANSAPRPVERVVTQGLMEVPFNYIRRGDITEVKDFKERDPTISLPGSADIGVSLPVATPGQPPSQPPSPDDEPVDPPLAVPQSITLEDRDPRRGFLKGIIAITPPSDAAGIDDYVIRWASSATAPLRDLPTLDTQALAASGAAIPSVATHIIAYARRRGTEAATGRALEIPDLYIKKIATSGVWTSSTCLLTSRGKIKCWGANTSGSLGQGHSNSLGGTPETTPDKIPFIDLGTGAFAVDVMISMRYACATLADGRLKCWGANFHPYGIFVGQRGWLGLGLNDDTELGDQPGEMGDALPALNFGDDKIVKGEIKIWNSCALTQAGTVRCWGTMAEPSGGSLLTSPGTPINFGVNVKIRDFVLGEAALCGVTTDNRTKCIGAAGRGRRAGSNVDYTNPNQLGDAWPYVNWGTGRTVKRLSGAQNMCAVLDNDRIKCYGNNEFGSLGYNDLAVRGDNASDMGDNLPEINFGFNDITQIESHERFSCVLRSTGQVYCWGDNTFGQLARGDAVTPIHMSSIQPVNLGTGVTARAISLPGARWACAIVGDWDKVKCWGLNDSGQLGLGDLLNRGHSAATVGDNLPYVSLGDLW